MLSFTHRRHITVDKLDASRRELIEFYLTLDLPKAWGKGAVVGADGTQFDFYENNLLAGYHFRYRKMGAVGWRNCSKAGTLTRDCGAVRSALSPDTFHPTVLHSHRKFCRRNQFT
jgi:hypothetical protein